MATIRWREDHDGVDTSAVIIKKSDGTKLTLEVGDCFMIQRTSVPNKNNICKVDHFGHSGEEGPPTRIFYHRWNEEKNEWGFSKYELSQKNEYDNINKTHCLNQGGGGSRKKRKLRKTRRHSTRRHSTRRHSTRRHSTRRHSTRRHSTRR